MLAARNWSFQLTGHAKLMYLHREYIGCQTLRSRELIYRRFVLYRSSTKCTYAPSERTGLVASSSIRTRLSACEISASISIYWKYTGIYRPTRKCVSPLDDSTILAISRSKSYVQSATSREKGEKSKKFSVHLKIPWRLFNLKFRLTSHLRL